MTVRILHTADIHLDAPFNFLGSKGAGHRHRIRQTFERIIALAGEDRYDLLLVAGDLFNDNQPSRDTQRFVASKLSELSLPVCILPGNHDSLEHDSVYHKLELPSNVHLLKERPSYHKIPELDLTVAGNPILSRFDDSPQLKDIDRNDSTRWFVAMAHGIMQAPGLFESTSRPVERTDIARTKADYVALGDWHAFADYSHGGVKACYSGAPEPTTRAEESTGKVVSITLSDQGIEVQPIQVGTVKARSLDLHITGLSAHEIEKAIQAEANDNCIMSIKLRGGKSADHLLDLEAIQGALADRFYWLCIDDGAMLDVTQIDPSEYPEEFVIGQFARLLSDRIEQAADERKRRVAEQALQLGVALLNGQKVL